MAEETETKQETVKRTTSRQTKPKEEQSTMIKVYNPQRFFYRQPSTGIKIASQKVTEIRNDSWADLQINAGVLEKAK